MRAVSRSHIQSCVLGAPFIVRAQVRAAYARMPHVLILFFWNSDNYFKIPNINTQNTKILKKIKQTENYKSINIHFIRYDFY